MINKFKLSSPFNYKNDLDYSMNDPGSFWNEISSKYKIHWDKPYEQVLNYDKDSFKTEWFKGGKINACFNALDKHIINGKGNEIAFYYEIPIKDLKFEITYKELYNKVLVFSRVLKNLGISKGDIVMIFMSNSFEAIISMLSCARIGAIHNIVYSGTLSDNLSSNINDSKPKLIIASSFGYLLNDKPVYYLPLIKDALLKSIHKPNHIIVFYRSDIPEIDYNVSELSKQYLEGSLNWNQLIDGMKHEPLYEYEAVESSHPLYITYTSGTTNKPKGIVRETGSNIVALIYSAVNIFGLSENSIHFFSSNFGWITSHYMIYASLFVGFKYVFIEGPLLDVWDMVTKYKVKSFHITPTDTRKAIKIDPEGKFIKKYDLSNIEYIYTGSEKVHQSYIDYLNKITNKPIHILYFQTETGWQVLFNPGQQIPVRGDSLGKVVPGGYQLRIVKSIEDYDDSKEDTTKVIELGPNEIGEIVIKLPLPPACCQSLYNDDESKTLYKSQYLNKYKGYFTTGDLGYYDKDGYYYYISRSGDTLTCGVHTINCNVIEQEILNNQEISECCIIGIKDEIFVEIPLVILVLKDNNTNQNEINHIKSKVSNFIINLFYTPINLKPIIVNVNNLPKNRNGKTLKSLIRSIFNGENYTIPPTLDNEDSVNELLDNYKKIKLY